MQSSPQFGQADLTNCERELIHLSGSIQPHGLVLVLREKDLVILQTSANLGEMLGLVDRTWLEKRLDVVAAPLAEKIRLLSAESDLAEPQPLQGHVLIGSRRVDLEGSLHRSAEGALILELEPAGHLLGQGAAITIDKALLHERLAHAVQQLSNASSISVLADAAVKCFRDLTGYDRVMVYKFDPDGHGKIIAEAREPRLESLLGHHYPASDIPQRARELYLRNRVRVLVDVHYEPVGLVPRLYPPTGQDLDLSLCGLRSMSPLHLQYLKNMGVTATLVVSLVREGRLWGLVAAHHYSPRNLRFALRAASAMLGEVISTRIAAIENYAHAQVAISVRRLEQRLIEATSTEGDWRLALFRNPRTLLQPLEATGAVLFFDDEILTTGDVPSTPELRALLQWVDAQAFESPFSCSSVGRANPDLESLTPTASGVLAVKLSTSRPEYLMWLRKEQLLTVTWAGDPSKAVVGNDPLELSPRRSFAAWSEIVRGTALPWSSAETALARAIGASLVDIILQIHAVRMLIAEHQLCRIRGTVERSREPVVIADASGRVLYSNEAFVSLVGPRGRNLNALVDVAGLCTQPETVSATLTALGTMHQPWKGELSLLGAKNEVIPVSVRAEVVPGPGGSVLGFILILIDLRDSKRAAAARRQLEQALSLAARDGKGLDQELRLGNEGDEVINAILTNASLAAMDIADASTSQSVAPLLEELEASTKRAAALYAQIQAFNGSI